MSFRRPSSPYRRPEQRRATVAESTAILDLEPPARQLTTLLSGVTDDQLSARTPCEEYTVGDLLDHLMGLTVAFRDAATKTSRPMSGGPPKASVAHLDADWRSRLPAQLDALVAAWRDPGAWEGTTEVGGVTLPGAVAGQFGMNELVIHGWDLARATGQPFECDPRSTEAIFALLSQSADADRGEGPFGPVVDVPPDAPLLDRAIGLSGRDPSWTSRAVA
ncbi:MAG: TIGR03086 family protein [Streptosporangiales bacterium]|nr:TIGR03086 family protein [Streptosporangiales bacterium]